MKHFFGTLLSFIRTKSTNKNKITSIKKKKIKQNLLQIQSKRDNCKNNVTKSEKYSLKVG